ncbi:MAG: type IV secretion system protein [Luteolibacter sp.]
MKRIIIITGLAMIGLSPDKAKAQWIVEDPAAIAQSATEHLAEIAKFKEMIDKQVKQIDLLTSQLDQITAYVDAFGDPSSLLNITGTDKIISQLRLPSSGQLLGDLQRASSGATSLTNTSGGLFRSIESINISGVEVPRHEELYRKYGALEDTETNYRTVHEESADRIKTLKEDISDTTRALQSATTDAEVQKLQGTLASQNAQLTALQGDVQNAATQVLVQDALNRNDEEKQEQARREKDAAEWGITNKQFDQLLTLPETKR